jgi:hypothetical protein
LACALIATAAGGCAAPDGRSLARNEEAELATAVDRTAPREAIAICFGYGCSLSRFAAIEPAEWESIRALLVPAAADAASERRAVAQAVGLFEQSVGRQLGTSADRPRTPLSFGDPSQLDCVDEAINTSSFLHLADRHGWLRWHSVGEPASRYSFLMFGVHFTAVLHEKDSGVAYAIDSWFHANGHPAEVVELDRWRAGWQP